MAPLYSPVVRHPWSSELTWIKKWHQMAGAPCRGGDGWRGKWGSRFSLIGWTDARKRRERKRVRERERKTTHGKSAPSSNKQIHHQLWQTARRITMSLSAQSVCEIQTRADNNKTRDSPYMCVLRGRLLCLATEFWRPRWRHFFEKDRIVEDYSFVLRKKKKTHTDKNLLANNSDNMWRWVMAVRVWRRQRGGHGSVRWRSRGGAAGRYVLDWQAIITAHFKSLSQGVWALALREGPWLVMKPPPSLLPFLLICTKYGKMCTLTCTLQERRAHLWISHTYMHSF